MVFPTLDFFVFFLIVFVLNWWLKKWPLFWKIFLLIASYYFYSVWSWQFLLILGLVSIFNWLGALLQEKFVKYKKWILTAIITSDLACLAWFKYYDFFRESLEALAGKFGFTLNIVFLHIILPVGLSFYIFRALAYNIDVYRQKYAPQKSLLDFTLYIAFFPQLLSGPIMRANDFFPQLENGGAKSIINFQENCFLILGGLFKKLVISSWLTTLLIDNVFSVPSNYSPLQVILAVYAYALSIYCDFSGYSDMAVGVAGFLGFQSPINFNFPYLAGNLQDFWRKWHISLSGWFRDYLYIPLGGNRKGERRTLLNIFLVMVVSGLWHGAGINFVIWGALHGLGSVAQNLWSKFSKIKISPLVAWILTFNFVCLAWVFFRAPDFAQAINVLVAIFNFSKASSFDFGAVWAYLALGAIFVAIEPDLKEKYISLQLSSPMWAQIFANAVFLLCIIQMSPEIIPPFIYFNF